MMGHGEPDAATVASLENNLMECLDYYEKILASQDFVAGKVRELCTGLRGFLTGRYSTACDID